MRIGENGENRNKFVGKIILKMECWVYNSVVKEIEGSSKEIEGIVEWEINIWKGKFVDFFLF